MDWIQVIGVAALALLAFVLFRVSKNTFAALLLSVLATSGVIWLSLNADGLPARFLAAFCIAWLIAVVVHAWVIGRSKTHTVGQGRKSMSRSVWPLFSERESVKADLPKTDGDVWMSDAYPLKQITVRIQGTRYSSDKDLLLQLEAVAGRLRAGEIHGEDHEDHFGYSFVVIEVKNGPSFFDETLKLEASIPN